LPYISKHYISMFLLKSISSMPLFCYSKSLSHIV